MKLTDLRPCDNCHGPVGFVFYDLQVAQHVVDSTAVRRHVGLAQLLGSERLAQVMGDSDREDATKAASTVRVVLCTACFCESVALAGAWDARAKADNEKPKACSPTLCKCVGSRCLYGKTWKCSECGATGPVVDCRARAKEQP